MYKTTIKRLDNEINISWIRIYSGDFPNFLELFDSEFRLLFQYIPFPTIPNSSSTKVFNRRLTNDIEVNIWTTSSYYNSYITVQCCCDISHITDIFRFVLDETLKAELMKEIFENV